MRERGAQARVAGADTGGEQRFVGQVLALLARGPSPRRGLTAGGDPTVTVVLGLLAFGVIFALNSAVHSYLILAYADSKKVAMNVGFYYMANACGRLAGTILSGAMYQWHGLTACLWTSVTFVLCAALLSKLLPDEQARRRT